jgi:putative tryptophan/tyrosine transport system substrate-binding protein
MDNRRNLIIALGAGALIASLPAFAQQPPPKFAHIGFLGNSTPVLEANLVEAFRRGMQDLGYKEGQNFAIEYRWAQGKYERFPALVAELLAHKVDVIVTAGTPAAQAVKKGTSSVPLVMVAVGDPVGTGIVASLNRPGGNITGLSSIAPELEGKRLELLREVSPKLSHVAVFWNPLNAFHVSAMKHLRAASQAMHVNLLTLEVGKAEDLDNAFAAINKARPDALFILADRVFLHNRARITDFAIKNRLPSINAYPELVEAGGLMSFGPSYEDMHQRAAIYVDKILKGARPADIPIEQPIKFELVVNMKTAHALGIKLPNSILVRADKVIE